MIFNVHGPIFWKFRSGTADVIFTPLYRALRKRGVRFHFFHRATTLHVATPPRGRVAGDVAPSIDRVDFDIQVSGGSLRLP